VKTAKQNKRISSRALTVKRKKKTVIDDDMPDLSNDPYFVEKAEKSREMLIKYGVPKSMK
jgi:hypothetical protein